MKRALAAAAASAWIALAQAQSAPPPKPAGSTSESSSAPTAQPPRRENIAPILDIRIERDGISLPKPRDDAPEKPPAK